MGDKYIRFLELCFQSFLSIIKVLLLSKPATQVKGDFKNKDELVILANGPSLNQTLTTAKNFLSDKTLLAVNFAVLSPVFEETKPQLYLIADPLFWIVPEKREQLFQTLAEKTKWDMWFFIPARASKNKEWKPILSKNPNIHICIYNTTPIDGFQRFCNFIFNRKWGVPRPHNVLIPAIATGLRLPFRKIYLAGADHSWLPEITVTDENVVLMHQKHFYDQGKSKPDTVLRESLNTSRLYHILYHMHIAFKSYFILESYSKTLNKEIINITPNSFIDAFKRMKI